MSTEEGDVGSDIPMVISFCYPLFSFSRCVFSFLLKFMHDVCGRVGMDTCTYMALYIGV